MLRPRLAYLNPRMTVAAAAENRFPQDYSHPSFSFISKPDVLLMIPEIQKFVLLHFSSMSSD